MSAGASDGAVALTLIQNHIVECSATNKRLEDAIKGVFDLLVSFIAGTIMVLLTFAGYSYAQSQSLATQLETARTQQAVAISQIPDETARRLKLSPNQP